MHYTAHGPLTRYGALFSKPRYYCHHAQITFPCTRFDQLSSNEPQNTESKISPFTHTHLRTPIHSHICTRPLLGDKPPPPPRRVRVKKWVSTLDPFFGCLDKLPPPQTHTSTNPRIHASARPYMHPCTHLHFHTSAHAHIQETTPLHLYIHTSPHPHPQMNTPLRLHVHTSTRSNPEIQASPYPNTHKSTCKHHPQTPWTKIGLAVFGQGEWTRGGGFQTAWPHSPLLSAHATS